METIVGIVTDFHDGGLATPATPMMILPIPQVSDDYNAAYANIQPLFWMVRTRDGPHAHIPAIAEQLRLASGGSSEGPPHRMKLHDVSWEKRSAICSL